VTTRLDNRIAVVTGGSRGIGAAIARKYAAAGARVVIASRKQEGLDELADEINRSHPDAVIPMACHVGRVADIARWWDAVVAEVGVPTILVNNAGTNPYFGPMLGCDWGAWEKTFEVNVKGPFEMIRQFVSRLDGREGAVVNIASILGSTASPMQGVYGMTKASIISMTQTLAVEFGKGNIPVRVNAIAPGIIDTKLAAALVHDPTWSKLILDRTAVNRIGEPEEIAGSALFLVSDDASYLTGQVLTVDGGYSIG
jgi:NAD(P)-dependent dehydrogenase (short-subunit alcohol dehydrogenase family)